jgi:hypothetical protein
VYNFVYTYPLTPGVTARVSPSAATPACAATRTGAAHIVYTHSLTLIQTHTHIHNTLKHTNTHQHMYACMQLYMYVCMCACVHTHTCIHIAGSASVGTMHREPDALRGALRRPGRDSQNVSILVSLPYKSHCLLASRICLLAGKQQRYPISLSLLLPLSLPLQTSSSPTDLSAAEPAAAALCDAGRHTAASSSRP